MAVHEIESDQFTEDEGAPRGPEIQGDVFDGYQDYFGFDDTFKYYLPDGKQYIEFRVLNEGQRAKYEKKTSRDVRFNRRTDDAAIKVDAAEDRHTLITESVINWHMVKKTPKGWQPVAFSVGSKGSTFDQWLDRANPQIVNDLHSAIMKANPWMSAEMTVEMIDEELQRLNDMRKLAVEREALEKGSANR